MLKRFVLWEVTRYLSRRRLPRRAWERDRNSSAHTVCTRHGDHSGRGKANHRYSEECWKIEAAVAVAGEDDFARVEGPGRRETVTSTVGDFNVAVARKVLNPYLPVTRSRRRVGEAAAVRRDGRAGQLRP